MGGSGSKKQEEVPPPSRSPPPSYPGPLSDYSTVYRNPFICSPSSPPVPQHFHQNANKHQCSCNCNRFEDVEPFRGNIQPSAPPLSRRCSPKMNRLGGMNETPWRLEKSLDGLDYSRNTNNMEYREKSQVSSNAQQIKDPLMFSSKEAVQPSAPPLSPVNRTRNGYGDIPESSQNSYNPQVSSKTTVLPVYPDLQTESYEIIYKERMKPSTNNIYPHLPPLPTRNDQKTTTTVFETPRNPQRTSEITSFPVQNSFGTSTNPQRFSSELPHLPHIPAISWDASVAMKNQDKSNPKRNRNRGRKTSSQGIQNQKSTSVLSDINCNDDFSSISHKKETSTPNENKSSSWFPPIASSRGKERYSNVFSQFYNDPQAEIDVLEIQRKRRKKKPFTATELKLLNYKHENALDFAEASWNWMDNTNPLNLSNYSSGESPFAYYRVIAETYRKYILLACHINVHGFHRGDLRFVEVPDKSRIEKLYFGDVLKVTELSLSREFEQLKTCEVSQETECIWIVKEMTILPRDIWNGCTFAFLENGTAIVKGHNEIMTVIPNGSSISFNNLYTGQAFVAPKIYSQFTEDVDPEKRHLLIAKASEIYSYENATGTIFSYEQSPEKTKMFGVGTDAFESTNNCSIQNETVEICALMGYSAVQTIFNGRFDCRAFPMLNAKIDGLIVKFSIKNPIEQPTEGRWCPNNRIKIGGRCGDVNAVIETVSVEEKQRRLQISARISKAAAGKSFNFKSNVYIVSQREPLETQLLEDEFFQKLPERSNGKMIIRALYGGEPIDDSKYPYYIPETEIKLPGADHPLNGYQCEYVSLLLSKIPLTTGSSPFGCGKSLTIVTAAIEMFKKEENISKGKEGINCHQLLITQSNYASVNLVEIAGRAKFGNEKKPKFLRFVSENNWNELPDNCRTPYDSITLLRRVSKDWALGEYRDDKLINSKLTERMRISLLLHVLHQNILQPDDLIGGALSLYRKLETTWKKMRTHSQLLIQSFFVIYRPDIIMTTADSLQGFAKFLGKVCSVQIDEASQLPECTLICLLQTFPNACYGLIGDTKQLPPYCEQTLTGKLKEFGIGNTMERAIENNLFPQATLRYIYRCHPKITELSSNLFYDGCLISGVKEKDRNEFITKKSDFWKNPSYPIMIINNGSGGRKVGTSLVNHSERDLVKEVIRNITSEYNGYKLNEKDIGVISFYAAQTSLLTETFRKTDVKCGTVDAFQGSEREVIVMCCTNERPSEFMQCPKRLNVALSRSRQATIIIGNINGLRKADYWKDIVKKVEENGTSTTEQNRKNNKKQGYWQQKRLESRKTSK